MGDQSRIEWTEATWNPTVGCTRASPGCKYCYAATMHARLTEMGMKKYTQPFRVVRPWPEHLDLPLRWKTPRVIFVNSMSDLFHDAIPLEYVRAVFDTMARSPWHTYQLLTKRSKRLLDLAPKLPWPSNVWMGVSVESSAQAYRASDLSHVQAAGRFLSIEPLLGPVPALPLDGIGWVIVGGESGPSARPMDPSWARQVRDQCSRRGVPFFLKQLGGRRGKRGGAQAVLDGRRWRQLPSVMPAFAGA